MAKLTATEARLLQALNATCNGIWLGAFRAPYKVRAKALREKGLVKFNSLEDVMLTPAGRKALPDNDRNTP